MLCHESLILCLLATAQLVFSNFLHLLYKWDICLSISVQVSYTEILSIFWLIVMKIEAMCKLEAFVHLWPQSIARISWNKPVSCVEIWYKTLDKDIVLVSEALNLHWLKKSGYVLDMHNHRLMYLLIFDLIGVEKNNTEV